MVASPDERVRFLTIHPVDLGIIIAYLAGMVLVGYLVAGRIRWFTDFFLAGRLTRHYLHRLEQLGHRVTIEPRQIRFSFPEPPRTGRRVA
jgi:hypothetical protein